MLEQDNYFEASCKKHACEDYSISGNINGMSYGIVCDGCSSSLNTHMGARILAHCAENFLTDHLMQHNFSSNNGIQNKDFESICFSAFYKAQTIVSSLMLNHDCLDSTLLIVICNENRFYTYIVGDGYLVYKRNDKIYVIKVEYESNAPYYLTYQVNSCRNKAYSENFKGNVVKTFYCFDENFDSIISYDQYFESAYCNHIDSDDIDSSSFVSIISDGADSFWKGRVKKSDLEIIKQIIEYKNFNGDFVKRRMNRFKKSMDKEEIYHMDDISVATVKVAL